MRRLRLRALFLKALFLKGPFLKVPFLKALSLNALFPECCLYFNRYRAGQNEGCFTGLEGHSISSFFSR